MSEEAIFHRRVFGLPPRTWLIGGVALVIGIVMGLAPWFVSARVKKLGPADRDQHPCSGQRAVTVNPQRLPRPLRHLRQWSRGAARLEYLVLAVVLTFAIGVAAWRFVPGIAEAATNLVVWIHDRLQQQLGPTPLLGVGPAPLWVWLVVAGGSLITIRVVICFTRILNKTWTTLLNDLLIAVAVLSLLALVVSWVPEWPWIPTEIREQVLALRQNVYQRELVRQLTAGWDWERLRLGATVWIALEGLGLWTASRLPIPLAGPVATVAVMGLVVLQYAAVGGGQPVWAIEHMIVHLMGLAGFWPTDVEALEHFTRERFAAHGHFREISPQSQGLLGAIAFLLAIGIRSAFR